MANQVS